MIPEANELYKDRYGNLIRVISPASDITSGERTVVFCDIYDAARVYTAALKDFQALYLKTQRPDDISPEQPEIQDSQGAGVPEELLKFLDAETFEEKLEIFHGMRGIADDALIDAVAVSLDTEIAAGALEDRFEKLEEHLKTLKKYECNRLR
ncbi:MAG: hypothetical protein K5985_05245 [Lachnospiraceae bacterium]|nr:hypothetical protein [Lachnospiraceae bacterium]